MNRMNRWKTAVPIVVLMAVALTAVASAQVQNNHEAEVLLEEAKHRALVDGDLERAIEICRKIVAEPNGNRAVVAGALMEMGQCYEKLGKDEARKAYERVVNEFADQNDIAAQARGRLAAMQGDNGRSGVTVRKVFDDWGAPSPDGRYLAFCHWDAVGDLAIHDVVTGEDRDLSDGKRSWDGRIYWADETPVWSPDGKQIAYGWHPYPNKGKTEELCIVGLDGSKPRVLYRHENEDVTSIDVHDWSRDGRFILAEFERKGAPIRQRGELVLVSVADGSVRKLTSLGPPAGRPAWDISRSLSPDGRYVVYSRSVWQKNYTLPHDDIFLLTTDGGGEEIPLVSHPAEDCGPIWTPDGKAIVFTSDRSGTYDTWLIKISDGKPVGEPRLVKKDTRSAQPAGFTREGSLYYFVTPRTVGRGIYFAMGDIYTVSIDPETGKTLTPPQKAIQQFEGSNAWPAWSPDGKSLAYMSARPRPGRARRRWVLVIRDMESSQERELERASGHFRWSPDGSSILFGRTGLNVYNLENERVTQVVQRGPGNGFIRSFAWSPGGKAVYYVRDGHVMMRELATGEEKEILVEAKNSPDIALSPDGRELAFTKDGKTLMVIPVEGGEPRELLSLPGEERFASHHTLAWSSDGRYILYSKNKPEAGGLWRISAEGGEEQKLVQLEAGTLANLSPHPDGRRITFTVIDPSEGGTWAIDNFLPELTDGK